MMIGGADLSSREDVSATLYMFDQHFKMMFHIWIAWVSSCACIG